MARRICQTLFTILVLYVVSIAAFGFLRWDAAERPDTGTVIGVYHDTMFGWVGGIFGSGSPPAADPAPVAQPAPAPVPPPATPAPPPAPEDERTRALRTVREELFPEARRGLAAVTVAGEGQLEEKAKVLGILVRARDLLNAILDKDPQDREANDLFKRYVEMRAAVEKR